jgi:hypothetical protein
VSVTFSLVLHRFASFYDAPSSTRSKVLILVTVIDF